MAAYVFTNGCVTKSAGAGHTNLGYLRFTFTPLARWKQNAEWYTGLRLMPTTDNQTGSWRSRVWRPIQCLGELFAWRFYRFVAYHISVGPFTVSYVIDREGHGPIGPVWPRNARR